MVGIVDQALEVGGSDDLDISAYHEALVDFIKKTDTPMTIGVQGEWGSGKTSLLNQIWSKLEESNQEHQDDENFLQIWVNSWEHSLLCSPEECLLKIVNEIIQELLQADVDKNNKDKVKDGVQSLMKGALRIGSSIAAGSAGTDAVDSFFSSNANTIKELRKQLQNLVHEIKELETNPYQRVIVYVDDLDRIEPRDAVSILELLKNIFNIKDCVFVLAIDYQVVVKGLKEKFGEPTPENEWEFRSFFDKIIQLPFTMPMNSYDIGKYVLSLLNDIKYYESDDDQLDEDLIESLVTLSIGTNPRSIKRLINSLSLIKILNDTKNESDSGSSGSAINNKDVATVMLAMVCLQIANSDIYDMLVAEPTFVDTWNDDFAYKLTQKKEESDKSWEENFKQALASDDFDEAWEQCLYRVCYVNPRQRPNATKYSKFLSDLRENYQPEEFQKFIATALKETAVTAVSATDKPNVRPPKGSFKPHFNLGYDDWIQRVKEDNPDYPDCPKEDTAKVIKQFIDIYKKSFNAVDQESEENKDGKAEHTIKYAGWVTFYHNKKKFFGMGVRRNTKGEYISMEVYKNIKNKQKPINFTKANISFDHGGKLEIIDVENKKVKGNCSYIEWMFSNFEPTEVNVTDTFVEFLIKYSIEGLKQRIEKDEKYITHDMMKSHLQNFKNKRRDSNDFKDAVKVIQDFYNPKNVVEIDE
tara:strand:- start:847 stop:2940 length:2094 start_codon:yes stop_codon:yes gene_type:complete